MSHGIDKALEFTAQQAVLAGTAKIVDIPRERVGAYLIVRPDGTVETHISNPDWHKEYLSTPAAMRDFIDGWFDRPANENVANAEVGTAATFVEESAVRFVFDRLDRRDIAVCPLTLSPQWTWLLSSSPVPMNQFDIVRLLKIVFHGCLPQDSTLLNLLKSVRFSGGQVTTGDVDTGRESLSKSIDRQLEKPVPEFQDFHVPVFDNFSGKETVKCAIEVIQSDQKFKITPLPQQMRDAMDRALNQIALVVGEDDEKMPPVYRGHP